MPRDIGVYLEDILDAIEQIAFTLKGAISTDFHRIGRPRMQ